MLQSVTFVVMKKLFNTLRISGKLDIQIDYHKGFGETAKDVIERKPFEYGVADKMIANNCIIRVEFLPTDKPMVALAYSHDLELALKDVFNQWKIWIAPKN